jgi:hypothetical protein
MLNRSTTCLLVAVLTNISFNEAHATCFRANHELKQGAVKENIEKILEYGRCIKEEQKARVGKWFCYVATMAGIQPDNSNNVVAGKIRPNPKEEKFFATISEISDDDKNFACEFAEYGIRYNVDGRGSNLCLSTHKVEFSTSLGSWAHFNYSADSYHFNAEFSNFTLYGGGEFVLFTTDPFAKSSYVSHGRCEKIN